MLLAGVEWIIEVLMYISTAQAVVWAFSGPSSDMVRPFADTIFHSIPFLAAVYFAGAILLSIGKLTRRPRIAASGLLFGVFIFTYTIAIEAYLIGFTVETIDVVVVTLVCAALYIYEKYRWRAKK